MKLIKRRDVFLSSVDKAGGDRGEFVLQMPYDLVFDEKMVFKMFVSQLNMRNSFQWITDANDTVFMKMQSLTDPSMPTPPTSTNVNGWVKVVLAHGCYNGSQLASMINEAIGFNYSLWNNADAAHMRCLYRAGRLYMNQENPGGAASLRVFFYFLPYSGGKGPCNAALGFPSVATIYDLQPTGYGYPGTHDNRRAPDGGSYLPPEYAMSPQLMDPDHVSDVIIRTSMPSDNYTITKDGPEMSGVTINVPIIVPPGGAIVYEDTVGVHAIYERARSVVNTLSIEVLDKHYKKLLPAHDWSFVLSIEQYEDVEGQSLQALQKAAEQEDEVIQLLKMLLLQKEFKARR